MKSTFKRLLTTAAAICTSAGVLSASASATELKYKFEKGQTLKYRVTNDTNADMDMGGQQMKQVMNMSMEMSITVKEIAEDGSATLETKYTSSKIDMDVPMAGKMSFDSSKKEGNSPMLESLGAMIDKPFTMVLASNGKVKEIKGLAELMGNNPMGEMFSEEQMKATFEQSFYFLPDGSAEVGKTWNRESAQGPMKFENTYTLKALDGGTATIDGVAKITLTQKEQMGMSMELKESEATSTITFDSAAGQLKKSVGTSKFTIAISGQGQNITQKATATTTTERLN